MIVVTAKELIRRWAACTCCPFLRFWPGDRDAEQCRAPSDPCTCETPPPPTVRWKKGRAS